jgi:hypothetical protein
MRRLHHSATLLVSLHRPSPSSLQWNGNIADHYNDRAASSRRHARQLSTTVPLAPSASSRGWSNKLVSLNDVGVIRIEGPHAVKFLQNLVTQDINDTISRGNTYALFLNRQGRVLHDSIITHIPSSADQSTASTIVGSGATSTTTTPSGGINTSGGSETFLLQLGAAAVAPLLAHLRLFLLRSKVTIVDESTKTRVWAALPSSSTAITTANASSLVWPSSSPSSLSNGQVRPSTPLYYQLLMHHHRGWRWASLV